MTSTDRFGGLRVSGWVAAIILIVTVMVFLMIRLLTDIPNLIEGTVPREGSFDRRYALNPVLAYLHILPGAVYLLGAPLQLSRRIRARNVGLHRRLGRLVLAGGVMTGVFAILVGIVMPFGGPVETSATVVFGVYFLVALALAYRAIRAGMVAVHRRWMIRGFAIGVGVGLIRVIVGIGEGLGLGIERTFGLAFWLAFSIMAVAAEAYLRMRPSPYA